MDKKSIMSRKTLKIILGICIVAVIAAVAGLFGYTYMADHNTLGRKISVNGLDVSRLNAQEAEDKIIASFENRPVSFQEDDQEIYSNNASFYGQHSDACFCCISTSSSQRIYLFRNRSLPG